MDINDIRKRRALINRQISKGFNANFSEENISKAYDDEFNKAHKVGDVHPNGKYVWTEYKPGKFDWRGVKKTKGSTAGSKVSPTAAAKVKADQAAKTPIQKSIDKQLVDAGYFMFCKFTNGDFMYLLSDPKKAGYKKDIAPAVTLLKKGGFRVGIYEQADGQNITNHYKKKITEFSYGPRVDCKDVPALAKSLTEVYHNFCCLQGRSWKARVENDGHFHITYNYPGSDGDQRDVGYAVVIPVAYGEAKPGDIMVHIEVGPKKITHLTDDVHEAEHTINIAKDKSASYSIKKAELQKIKAQLQAAQDKLTKEEQTINAWVDKVNNM